MKIIHITEDHSFSNYGVTTILKALNKNLNNNGILSRVISVKKDLYDNETIIVGSGKKVNIWKYAYRLKEQLYKYKDNIFHIHGVWMYPQFIASKIAFKEKSPYIISPHGMLEPWIWKKGTLKKKLYFNLLIKKYFSNANIIHAITLYEKENLFSLLNHKNIEVIPNSIDFSEIEKLNLKKEECGKYILFLGRLTPIKGIDLLIKAFSKIKSNNIKLKIAGPKNRYQKYLVNLVKNLGIDNKVDFLDYIQGKEKYQLYKNAWVFVAPSHSEVVGMVNLEAASVGTPVITTFQTGLLKNWNDNGGILINPGVDELYEALNKALNWSEKERDDRGRNLKEFVFENYSWERNILKWIELYKSLGYSG